MRLVTFYSDQDTPRLGAVRVRLRVDPDDVEGRWRVRNDGQHRRAHMAHLGAPIVGDPLYGKQRAFKAEGPHAEEAAAAVAAFPRQALHAAVLGFKHPVTREELRFESDLPEDMEALLETLRKL